MSEIHPQVAQVEADPAKPYKAIVAFVLSFATALYASIQGNPEIENLRLIDWAIIVLGALVVAGGTYATRNPLVARSRRT